jgi:hypothetical protein
MSMRPMTALVAGVIRIDAVWLATYPLNMGTGMDSALARVVKDFGAEQCGGSCLNSLASAVDRPIEVRGLPTAPRKMPTACRAVLTK